MASRMGPEDQDRDDKAGNGVDETSDDRTVSRDSQSSCRPANGSAAINDGIELSLSPELRESLQRSLLSVPDIDSAQVAEVKAAIESGDYETDARAIAEAMIRFERALGE